MCGICGIVYRDPSRTVELQPLQSMCRAMTHRGPDDEGYFIKGSVGLGMRRLSIIDLQTGHQPIFNEDRSLALVFNGEIYNFQELREGLEQRGHRFQTRSDTEVIVHLYEEKGRDCLKDLNGMFAFALFDSRQKELFLARDRVGIKPLYYVISDQSVIFASEIKSLVDVGFDPAIDPASLASYLRFKYVPSPRTIFRNVQKLPPGHAAFFKNNRLDVYRYWSAVTEVRWDAGATRAAERLLHLLEDSVRLRLISDVPVGVFLSGGMDSSIITALAAKMRDQPVKTFSLGFHEQEYDESAHARAVAEWFKTDHQEEIIIPRMTDSVPDLIWHMDEPVSDPSTILSYYVSRLASRKVKVVLLGDGSDELFAGYTRYSLDHLLGIYSRVPAPIRAHLFNRFAQMLPESETNGVTRVLKRARNGLLRAGADPLERYLSTISVFDSTTQDALFDHDTKRQGDPAGGFRKIFDQVPEYDTLAQIQHIDLNAYLPEDLLLKADKMTMAHSIEGRFPFLDHRIVEFASTLPANLKMRRLVKKYVLRQAFRDILPPSVLRRRKQGFGIPIQKWMKKDLREMVHDLLLDRNAFYLGHLSGNAARDILDRYEKGADELHEQVWSLFTLEVWLRKFTGVRTK